MSRPGDFLQRLGAALNDPGGRRRVLLRLRAWLRRLFFVCLIAGVVFLWLVDRVGERNLFTAFFLFVPGQVWLLPLGGFLLAALVLWDWRLLLWVAAACVALVWLHLGWEVGGAKPGGGGPELVVMTFNRGQRVGSLQPFKQEHEPDIIAMQDAGRQSGRYLKADGYSDLAHGADIGEFMLLSRFPIRDKGLLEFQAGGRGHRVAAWFVIDFGGEEVVVYNVHMNTPRDQLKAFRRGAFLRGLWPRSAEARSYQQFWDCQIELARLLLEHIAAERRPVIVVGDLNTPDRGHIYRQFRRRLQDAHDEAGHGFGWTFPGQTRNPLTLFGPWLRIDHQFAGDGWAVLGCRAEAGRKSQHLAVVAKYERRR